MGYIEFEQVSKSFDETKVVDDVSFKIDKGHVLGILGPSGSGKTTIMRMVAGFEKPDSGKIMIDEDVVFDFGSGSFIEPEKRGISMVFQDLALWPHMTCRQHLEFALEARGGGKKDFDDVIATQLEKVGLGDRVGAYPHELSGGEKQRLSIARALVQEPKVLLFDEPLSNLDQILRKDLMREFISIKKEYGITTIYVTHNYKDILDLCDNIAVIDNGRVVQMDKTKKLFQKPKNDFVAHIIGRA